MMKAICTYEGDRDEQIIARVYDEIDSSQSLDFDAHVTTCAACREELAALGAVRTRLREWNPPMPAAVLSAVGRLEADVKARSPRVRVLAALKEIPAWTQVAAALLFMGVAAGIAHLDVSYDQRGLSVRTGWLRQEVAPAPEAVGASAAPLPVTVSGQPWRGDLESLERQLRAEFRTQRATSATPEPAVQRAVTDAELARSVRPLIEESERRQQRELALRLAEAARDVEVQRRADLEKIDYMIQGHLGAVQNTGVEVMRQRQMINDLAIRVNQRP
jgi:hypothetical protein